MTATSAVSGDRSAFMSATGAITVSAMAAPLYFRSDTSLEHETGPHPEGPGRIPAIEAAMQANDWLGYERVDAPAVDLDVLQAVHPHRYVTGIRELSESGGGAIDADTVASPG